MVGSHRPQGCQTSFTALLPPTGSGYFIKYITTVVIGWILRTWRTVRATHAPSRNLSSDSSRDSMLKPMACEIQIKLNKYKHTKANFSASYDDQLSYYLYKSDYNFKQAWELHRYLPSVQWHNCYHAYLDVLQRFNLFSTTCTKLAFLENRYV